MSGWNPMGYDPDDDLIPLPRWGLRFPVELVPPPGFVPEDMRTWPRIDGRFEWVDGRLLYMPPCGDIQQTVSGAVVGALHIWSKDLAEFVLGGNEAGMRLQDDIRGADAAIWRKSAVGTYTGSWRNVPPILAVEVTGREENEAALRRKADWYFDVGVTAVWLVLAESREVLLLRRGSEERIDANGTIFGGDLLPGLEIPVRDLFRKLD